MTDDFQSSERFKRPITRRDWLGTAAAWSGITAFLVATLGALRLPLPWVFPEASSRSKLGRPDRFAVGQSTYFEKQALWLYREREGFHAISAVCTHLGCLVKRQDDLSFKCPCHGSRFAADGSVTGGPAPKALRWTELSVSPEGWLVADTLKEVDQGTRLEA